MSLVTVNGFNVQEDVTGQRFFRLTAVAPVYRSSIHSCRSIVWEFICDCGNKSFSTVGDVRRGHIKSCGCFHRDELRNRMKKPDGVAAFNALYINYKGTERRRRSKGRIIGFSLSKDEFRSLVFDNCFYCGTPPQQVYMTSGGTSILYNGVDRVDSKGDYTLENCVPCCGNCNKAKQALSQDDFLSLVSKIYHHRVLGG